MHSAIDSCRSGLERRTLWRGVSTAAVVACCFCCAGLQAQRTTGVNAADQSSASAAVQDRDDAFERQKEMEHRLDHIREKERQKRIVVDANRLVELTALYRKSLEAHGTPTADDEKLLLQIEKLAREVKDRMRGM